MPITPTEMTGSGPYKWNSSLGGEYISLVRNNDWRWDIRDVETEVSTESTKITPESETEEKTSEEEEPISGFEIFVVLSLFWVATVYIKFKRKEKN